MQKIISIIVLASLAGCAPSRQAIESALLPSAPVILTQSQEAEMREGLERVLRDPESLRLRDVQAVRTKPGHVVACGWANGRNGFGGYEGFTPFSGVFTDSGFQVTDLAAEYAQRVKSQCSVLGIKL